MKNFRVSVLLTFKNPITYYLLPITMLYNVGLCTVIDFQKSFKIAVLVYQCLNGQAPSYLADDCQLVSDIRPRRLRSSDSGFCAIRRSRTTYGDRCFAAAGPRVWNSLPTELRQSDNLAQFKRRLKTHL